jgi:glycerol-3-phosphate acyltransferase PlsX
MGALGTLKDKLDSRRRNGAMFVGLNGIAVKSHGRADAYAFCNAISVAVELHMHNINAKITSELTRYGACEVPASEPRKSEHKKSESEKAAV